ncbi:MAG TPA: HAD hydrolase-like protein [Proteiniclasticum sp.]|nr:HAD hydrolase-like protein [Proteiniclasticum sp.]
MDKLKSEKILICIDSDGCAIDSMTVKHEKAFGPALVEIWEVSAEKQEAVLKEWNDINLYTMTRGINRFQGLVTILGMYPEYADEEQLYKLKTWVETTNTLSPESLKKEYNKSGLEIMKKALAWSDRVNEIIRQLPLAEPFAGVKETMELMKSKADIAVVSSANKAAIEEEWKKSGLYDLVDYFFAQDDGTKSECIKKLLETGYDRKKTIMVGDAIGDYEAAKNNQVWYYPILASKEEVSWSELNENYLSVFLSGGFDKEVQNNLLSEMNENLL